MPKVSIYLPDDLYRRARERDLPISALAQGAIEAALRRTHTDDWIASVRRRPPRVTESIDTAELLAKVRDEFDQ
jgi:post-segregation antitoxin (ccd killing protein)